MKREFKFRIWSHTLQRWVTDLFLENIADVRFATLNSFFEDMMVNESIEVQQYTGWKDKNGKEIYEGDTLEWIEDDGGWTDYRKKHVGDVQWSRSEGRFIIYERGGIHSSTNYFWMNQYTITGNIYEKSNTGSRQTKQKQTIVSKKPARKRS